MKFQKIVEELGTVATHLEETGCTCVDRKEGHERGCMGVSMTRKAFKLIEEYKKAPVSDPIKKERERIRVGLRAKVEEIVGLTPGEGGRGDTWVDAARNMYQGALKVVRR